jgi:hypothetical protein
LTWLDGLTLETIVVHTKAGSSLKGLKLAVFDDCIVLRDAMLLEEAGPVMLDGEIPIPRESVDFMQNIRHVEPQA